jgi:multidrug efflux pump subunit AcrA (membrane-fusion protein)
VDLPFKGVITALLVKSGQRVAAGEVLARYRLTPEAILAIRQRLFPLQVSESEVKLAEVERSLAPLKNRKRELTQLVQKKLAAPDSLSMLDREIQLVTQEQKALNDRLRQDRQTLQVDRALLQEQLGDSAKNGGSRFWYGSHVI